MTSIGEALVHQLAGRGVEVIFGIPGVHTVELYRGLEASGIRHVTPRHEQGAGFMADGYARVSGRPGVAFVITGPGLTNTLTPMAQARADSIPMLVISGVNTLPSLGRGMGHLHELPDQRALAGAVALTSERIESGPDLTPALDRAFARFSNGRPGPVHIEVPLDVAGADYDIGPTESAACVAPFADYGAIIKAARLLAGAMAPVILAGGGASGAASLICSLAERLDAPVVQTVNGRGIMHKHRLGVPASPSLRAVRSLIEASDLVLAIGTELGPTDYDMYATGTMAQMKTLVRIDICPDQLARHSADVKLLGGATDTLNAIIAAMPPESAARDTGAQRADEARQSAFDEIGADMQAQLQLLEVARDTVPNAIMVGDSAQPVYSGNLYYDHDRPGGWFNAATGYGALGYAIPAAIGAALADPSARVLCIAGDGGAQFSLPELMAAVDENLPVTFIIWNNHGYQEIAASMKAAGVQVIGCDPTPPDFAAVAASCGMPFQRCQPEPQAFAAALSSAMTIPGPTMIEVEAPSFSFS